MDNQSEYSPELPHSYATIMAWLSSAQDTFSDKSGFWTKNSRTFALALPRTLPAGYFRRNPQHLFNGSEVHKRFLSSGTTSATKAVAMFSKQGLELYRCGALATFNSVLRHYWGNTSGVGLSLIARGSDAPSSSLAAMISWFAEAGDITYTTAKNFQADVFRANVLSHKACLYIWGTAANYLQLFKRYESIPLPADSLVFETGGIKAGGIHLKLEEFHQRLAEFFHLKQEHIVSEYGMCEIASQAYRFGGVEEFRFPVWVTTLIKPNPMSLPPSLQQRDLKQRGLRQNGTGSLVLHDYLRQDYPYLFCTEDRALLKDGKFKLLGRIGVAPQRGCSLDYIVDSEIIVVDSGATHAAKQSLISVSRQPITQTAIRQRVNTLLPALHAYLRTQAETELIKEFADSRLAALACSKIWGESPNQVEALRQLQNLAALACADIWASLPTDDWLQALQRSLPQPELRSWLYILPASHSLVGIYPLCFGYCLGLAITVKLTEQRRLPLTEGIVSLLNSLSPAAQIKVHKRRTTAAVDKINVDAVLCYGSDATLTDLQKTHPTLPFAGFGTHDTVLVIAAEELHELRAEISKDVCSLAQQGCFAAKILFCVGAQVSGKAIVSLQESLSSYRLPPLSATERLRYESLEAKFTSAHPFQCALLTLTSKTDYEQLLPRAGGVLPLVLVKDRDLLIRFLQQQPTIKTIVCSDSQNYVSKEVSKGRVKVGKANTQAWDGLHEGRPLFATKKC